MEDLAVYGYLTPSRIKIVVALALTDAVIRDIDVITVRLSVLKLFLSPTVTFLQGLQGVTSRLLSSIIKPIPHTKHSTRGPTRPRLTSYRKQNGL